MKCAGIRGGGRPFNLDRSQYGDAYASASFIRNNRVVFNIKGNDYRLIVAVAYQVQIVYIKFIGTHAEYNDVDASKVEMV